MLDSNYPLQSDPRFSDAFSGYEWHDAENKSRAEQWAQAIYAAQTRGLASSGLLDALHDLWSYDRALAASIINGLASPHRAPGESLRPFDVETSKARLPYEAIDAVARLIVTSPPDRLLMQADASIRRVIAQYANWYVTVCEIPLREDEFRSFSVTMPALGESVTNGTVSRWLKKVGDSIAIDEPICEVSTDKVDTEIPSPCGGQIIAISAQEDEAVAVGEEIAVIRTAI